MKIERKGLPLSVHKLETNSCIFEMNKCENKEWTLKTIVFITASLY